MSSAFDDTTIELLKKISPANKIFYKIRMTDHGLEFRLIDLRFPRSCSRAILIDESELEDELGFTRFNFQVLMKIEVTLGVELAELIKEIASYN